MQSDAGSRFAPVLQRLYREVHQTKQTVHEYANQLNSLPNSQAPSGNTSGYLFTFSSDTANTANTANLKKRSKELLRRFRYGRTIFHPSETPVNIFFLMAIALKWIFFIVSFLWCTTISFGPKNASQSIFLYVFGAMQILSTMITIVEIVFHLHVGYVDPKSGRIVMEPYQVYRNYLSSKSKFPVDLISLIPFWIISLFPMLNENHTMDNDLSIIYNLRHRLIRILPLCTIIIQLARSLALFCQPPQAQPFHMGILSLKYFIKVILTVFSIFRYIEYN